MSLSGPLELISGHGWKSRNQIDVKNCHSVLWFHKHINASIFRCCHLRYYILSYTTATLCTQSLVATKIHPNENGRSRYRSLTISFPLLTFPLCFIQVYLATCLSGPLSAQRQLWQPSSTLLPVLSMSITVYRRRCRRVMAHQSRAHVSRTGDVRCENFIDR